MANILTQDIGGGSSKYPSKRSINLHIEESHTRENAWAVVIFAIFMVALGFFTKFFVIDKITEINQAEAQYNSLQQQVAAVEDANGAYENVVAAYNHYGNSYLNDEELALQDRMAIMDVIESEPLQDGTVTNISITDNVAVLTMKSQKLEDVSSMVASVEAHDIVDYVIVASANTKDQDVNSEEGTDQTVISTMTIYFKTPADLAAEADAAGTESAEEESTEAAEESSEEPEESDAAGTQTSGEESGVNGDAE